MTGFESKRQAAQAKLDDDDAQGYIAEYEAALLVSYQSGFADGKRSVQRKPLTDEDLKLLSAEWRIVYGAWMDDFARDIEAKLKEKNGY